MTHALSLRLLTLSLLVICAAYVSAFLPAGAPDWAPWCLLVGTVSSLLCVSALGAASGEGGGAGRLTGVLALAFLLVAGGLGVVLLLPDPVLGDRLFLGLPAGAAVVVYVVGLLPLLVVPLAYAWTFPELGFREGELEAVRERARVTGRSELGKEDDPKGGPGPAPEPAP